MNINIEAFDSLLLLFIMWSLLPINAICAFRVISAWHREPSFSWIILTIFFGPFALYKYRDPNETFKIFKNDKVLLPSSEKIRNRLLICEDLIINLLIFEGLFTLISILILYSLKFRDPEEGLLVISIFFPLWLLPISTIIVILAWKKSITLNKSIK